MQKKMDKVVASIWRNDNNLLQSQGDLINLASLIEAEAKIIMRNILYQVFFIIELKKA